MERWEAPPPGPPSQVLNVCVYEVRWKGCKREVGRRYGKEPEGEEVQMSGADLKAEKTEETRNKNKWK